ncbi:MAG TPA: PEP-CTERM sorting domain-containing protein [Gammaproteobacteria bacterium]
MPLTIDFTDSRWSGAGGLGQYSQSYGSLGVSVEVLGGSGDLTFNAGGPSSSAPLALDGDGLGIGDDEIGGFGVEGLHVTFDSAVTILGYYLLDLFDGEGPNGEAESAYAAFGANTTLLALDTAFGTETPGEAGFYARDGLRIAGVTDALFTGTQTSYSDFALAGIIVDYDPVSVPEPGALSLLCAGLLVAAAGRRARRNASRRAA